MTEETKNVVSVEVKEEEPAPPALPTTEPPKDDEVKPAAEPAKTEEAKEEPKAAPEPPKDPREDPIGWIAQQIPGAVHVVNYNVLDYLQKYAVDDESKRQPLPGKNGAVTRNQFLAFLKDGTLLANLAKKLGGSVETVHEGEEAKTKENQVANINAFTEWAKTTFGLTDEQAMSADDLLEKGKAGYQKVFLAVWNAATQAGIDVDAIAAQASAVVKSNIIQTILNFFKRARPTPQLEKKAALEAEEAKKNAEEQKAEEIVEEECKKESVNTNPTPAVVEAN